MQVYKPMSGTDKLPIEEQHGAYIWVVCVIMALALSLVGWI